MDRFGHIRKALESALPMEKPVRVIRRAMRRDQFGQAEDYDDYYRILVNAEKDMDLQIDTLIHEWAHLLSGWIPGKEHSDQWGICYAQCYRVARGEP